MIGARLGRGTPQAGGLAHPNVCRTVPATQQRGDVVTFKYKGQTCSRVFEELF